MCEAEDINEIKGRNGGNLRCVREWGLTVVRDGRQDLGLDVLQGETLPGASNNTLRDDGLCRRRDTWREWRVEGHRMRVSRLCLLPLPQSN